MGAEALSSRAILGELYLRLDEGLGRDWVDAVSMPIVTDQGQEEHRWLGRSPQMREWIGGRHVHKLRDSGIIIPNKHFEATLEVLVDDLRRDKTGQVMIRVADLARKPGSHWASIISTLIQNGASGISYDGQFFFDTDHSEGESGTQSNQITVDISAVPVGVHGADFNAPSPEEFAYALMQGIQAMYGFKDDVGEPLNETARRFLVMTPIKYWGVANAAVKNQMHAAGATNTVANLGLQIDVAANSRLTWTDRFAIFATDQPTKPIIRQREGNYGDSVDGVNVTALAEGSEEEFKNKRHLYGVDAHRNVGYGFWQHACQVILV